MNQLAATPNDQHRSYTSTKDDNEMVSCKISIPDGHECGKLIKYGSRKKHIIKIHNIEKTDAIHYLNDRMFLPLGVFNKVRRR